RSRLPPPRHRDRPGRSSPQWRARRRRTPRAAGHHAGGGVRARAMMRAAALTALAVVALVGRQTASDLDRDVRDVLARTLQFTASEIADVQRGRAVKHGLAGHAPGAFGVAGAVRIAARTAE